MFKDCELILSVKEAEDRNKWLEIRNKGIGGSDASIICGVNRYKSPYDLWLEKTGQKEPPDLSNNWRVYFGIRNEASVAEWFSEVTGKKIQRMGTVQSKSRPYMLANVDRVIVGENAGLEIKTAGVEQAKKWKGDEIPDSYYLQCLHYMAVTGADRWYIAVLIGGNDPKWKVIERNEGDILALLKAEEYFWHLVETKTAPAVDGSQNCAEALGYRYRNTNGEEIDLPEEADGLIARIQEDTRIKKALEAQITENENKLKEMLGENESGRIGAYKVTWKATAGRETLSLTNLKKKSPNTYVELKASGFISTSKPARRFSIKELDD